MVTPERKRFTLEEYYQMSFLGEDDRVEFMNGEVITMSPIGRFHAACVKRLNFLLTQRLGVRAIVSAQDPLIVLDSEPIPDIVLLKFREDFYAAKAASAEDALLVIEVSDSTLNYDRTTKVALYAKADISEVWVIDLNGQRVWVYRQPAEDGYLSIRAYERGETLTLLAFPDITLTVNDILGERF
ncbi:MAG: Uma2 family endonuclease [Trueperaceae bacterium]